VTVKDQINARAGRVQNGGRGAIHRRGPAASVKMTDLGADLSKLTDELAKKVCPTAVGYCGTIVRKEAVRIIRAGGGANAPGDSRKTKTRGVPGIGKKGQPVMKPVGRGSWGKSIWSAPQNRGMDGRSLADPGSIIKKPISRKRGGLRSSQIVGPRYEKGADGKNFAHTHEAKEGANSGAPNHKWWNKKGRPLKNRPFMKPASENTMPDQQNAIKRALKRWEIDEKEVF